MYFSLHTCLCLMYYWTVGSPSALWALWWEHLSGCSGTISQWMGLPGETLNLCCIPGHLTWLIDSTSQLSKQRMCEKLETVKKLHHGRPLCSWWNQGFKEDAEGLRQRGSRVAHEFSLSQTSRHWHFILLILSTKNLSFVCLYSPPRLLFNFSLSGFVSIVLQADICFF